MEWRRSLCVSIKCLTKSFTSIFMLIRVALEALLCSFFLFAVFVVNKVQIFVSAKTVTESCILTGFRMVIYML